MTALDTLVRPVKQAIATEVVNLFNDSTRGEKPVPRRADGLFGPRSVAWRVHGDVTGMLTGGLAGLMLQMLHPRVLAGVWDHSRFRDDMSGRLRPTARFSARTTSGGREEAEKSIAQVRAIHDRIRGTLPDGTPYCANDPDLLAWVHVTETTTFLAGYIRYAEPNMPASARDRYFAEMAQMGEALGADPVPRSQADARRIMEAMRPQLRYDERTREISRLLLNQAPASPATEPVQALARQAGLDLLPEWARDMHRLRTPWPTRPLVRAGTLGVARTLRWAFS